MMILVIKALVLWLVMPRMLKVPLVVITIILNIIAAIKQHTHVGRQDSDVLDGAILHNLLTFNDLKTHLIKQFRKITYKIM